MRLPPREAKSLYEEVTNSQATWVDAVFWMVIGAVLSGGVEVLFERGLAYVLP